MLTTRSDPNQVMKWLYIGHSTYTNVKSVLVKKKHEEMQARDEVSRNTWGVKVESTFSEKFC